VEISSVKLLLLPSDLELGATRRHRSFQPWEVLLLTDERCATRRHRAFQPWEVLLLTDELGATRRHRAFQT
jgi:hypothetical protein